MSELLIIDRSMPDTDQAYLQQLGLPKETETVRKDPGVPYECKSLDRAIYLVDLRNSGPYPDQYKQVNDNPGVGNWIVCALDAKPIALKQYRFFISPSVSLFTDADAARAVLQTRPAPRESCLIISMNEGTPAEAFAQLLGRHLGTWSIQLEHRTADQSIEAMIRESPSARVVLLGNEVMDFQNATWPEGVHPYIVVIRGRAFLSLAEAERLLRIQAEQVMPGVSDHHVFFADIQNELWHQEVKDGIRKASSLAAEPLFCIQDQFGLPASLQSYKSDAEINAYLAQFTACAELARQMSNSSTSEDERYDTEWSCTKR